MTARHEGVTVTLADGQALHLSASLNALCDFEVELSRLGLDPVRELDRLESGARPPVVSLRALVWATARGSRPDLTVSQVGDMLETDGPALTKAVFAALAKAGPEQAPGDGDAPGKATPPRR